MKEKLIKLLNLTSSDNDSEALSAMRKANQLLEVYETNWHKLLGLTPQQIMSKTSARKQPSPSTNPAPAPEETVKEKFTGEHVEWMLKECSDNPFVQSLNAFYTKCNFLTQKQYDSLVRTYESKVGVS